MQFQRTFGTIGVMTMTLGFSVRPLDDLPTEQVVETMQAFGKLGGSPLARLVVPGTYRDAHNAIKNRWTAKEAGAKQAGYSAMRILSVNAKGKTQWLSPEDAKPIFDDIEKAGTFVSIPNVIAGGYFYMLASISLPWSLRGAWLAKFPDRRYRLPLPSTVLDDMKFGVHQYHMLQCKGLGGDDSEDGELAAEIAEGVIAFFRCAQRHKLLTDFY